MRDNIGKRCIAACLCPVVSKEESHKWWFSETSPSGSKNDFIAQKLTSHRIYIISSHYFRAPWTISQNAQIKLQIKKKKRTYTRRKEEDCCFVFIHFINKYCVCTQLFQFVKRKTAPYMALQIFFHKKIWCEKQRADFTVKAIHTTWNNKKKSSLKIIPLHLL